YFSRRVPPLLMPTLSPYTTLFRSWEMATLGDPLVDLGLMLVYKEQPVIDDAVPATSVEGFPDSAELVEMYATTTGRDVSRLGWYVAFGCFKQIGRASCRERVEVSVEGECCAENNVLRV